MDELTWEPFSGAAGDPGHRAAIIDFTAAMEQTWLTYCPGAEREVLASAGHYPMVEIPVAPAASIERFPGRE